MFPGVYGGCYFRGATAGVISVQIESTGWHDACGVLFKVISVLFQRGVWDFFRIILPFLGYRYRYL